MRDASYEVTGFKKERYRVKNSEYGAQGYIQKYSQTLKL